MEARHCSVKDVMWRGMITKTALWGWIYNKKAQSDCKHSGREQHGDCLHQQLSDIKELECKSMREKLIQKGNSRVE